MLKLGIVGLLAVGMLGACGGKERKLCDHVNDLCKSDLSSKDLAECASDLSEAKDEMGDQYDKFMTCGIEADSCMEAVGCGMGAAMNLGAGAMKQMEKGFSKMR